MKRLHPDDVACEIAALDGLDIKTLRDRWRKFYRTEPPTKVRSGFLTRAIAYRIQELAYGGLKPSTRRRLHAIAAELRANRKSGTASAIASIASLAPRHVLLPGSQLMREWQGVTMLVDVLPDGFGWRGRTYKTLSAVAGAITGTKWSGPKFFGLRVGVHPPLSQRAAPSDRNDDQSQGVSSVDLSGVGS